MFLIKSGQKVLAKGLEARDDFLVWGSSLATAGAVQILMTLTERGAMQFDDGDFLASGFSRGDIKRLHAMATGGRTGSGGFRYQTRYAVWKMIEAASLGLDMEELSLFSVMEQGTCFVDDIIVNEDDSHFTFCQLKTSNSEVWHGQGDRRKNDKLLREFLAQVKLNRHMGLERGSFELLLVTPHASRVRCLMGDPRKRDKIPRGLKYCTRVELFPDVRGRHAVFLAEHPPSCAHLDRLCAVTPGPSLQLQIYAAFWSAWVDLSEEGEPCEVTCILDELYKNDTLPLRGSSASPPSNWEVARAVLEQIPDFGVELEDGFCQYSYRFQRGHIPHRCDTWGFRQFMERIVEREPRTFNEFKDIAIP